MQRDKHVNAIIYPIMDEMTAKMAKMAKMEAMAAVLSTPTCR